MYVCSFFSCWKINKILILFLVGNFPFLRKSTWKTYNKTTLLSCIFSSSSFVCVIKVEDTSQSGHFYTSKFPPHIAQISPAAVARCSARFVRAQSFSGRSVSCPHPPPPSCVCVSASVTHGLLGSQHVRVALPVLYCYVLFVPVNKTKPEHLWH